MSALTHPLNRYRYDALDRLVELEPSELEKLTRFYCGEHLVTQLKGQGGRCVLQHDRQLLAVQSFDGVERNSQLLVTDQQRSVLQLAGPDGVVRQVYAPYGHRRLESGPGSLLGFTGEAVDPATGHYLLGNGHRAFNPVLMRFNSPDGLSPFGRGGLNPYAYCLGDPVNFSDPTGRFVNVLKIFTSGAGLFSSLITLKPSVPFKVANKALANGAAFRASPKQFAGATASVTAGIMGVGVAATGLASTIIAAIDPESPLITPLAFVSAALATGAVLGRVGSAWVGRDPKAIAGLKALGEKQSGVKGIAVSRNPRPSSISLQRNHGPSAPDLSQFTPVPSAPSPRQFDVRPFDWMTPEIDAVLNKLGGKAPLFDFGSSRRSSISSIRST
ncbi:MULTISPECIES: RHS repeat-associated core domain-containing protein [Pseudomonas]|uniref:RHS repeat-associated core domain-containing protein n=1 Tax=Pseudomonas monachiensis TaxID=3060212 RepID=A0ABW9HCY4_9PSED|nr:RHS repeat-associated core domain-containing protein [Pseudomonas sp. BF-RE-26]